MSEPIKRKVVTARIVNEQDVRLVLDDGSELVGLDEVNLRFGVDEFTKWEARGCMFPTFGVVAIERVP